MGFGFSPGFSEGILFLTILLLLDKITVARRNGGMADAHGSGPCEVKFMWVQVPFPALIMSGLFQKKASFVFQ